MKQTFYLLLVLITFLSGCKRGSDLVENPPAPEPEPTGALTAAEFLKDFDVVGAKTISFDTATNSYLVDMPDGYDNKKAEVRLELKSSIALEDSLGKLSSENVILSAYQGTGPLVFHLRRKTGNRRLSFQVYFRFSGAPQIELMDKEVQVYPSYIKFNLRYLKNVGSIPSAPGKPGALVKVFNTKTRQTITTSFNDHGGMLYDNLSKDLITGDLMNVEITLQGQKPVVFEGVKFIKGKAVVYPSTSYKYQVLYKDTIRVYGDNFVPGQQYSVRFSNDFLDKPLTAAARIVDGNFLSVDKIPFSLPEGSYLLSFYEGERFIGNASYHVSFHETNAIESIWKGNIYLATMRSVNPVSVGRGESFFVKASPVAYGYFDSQITVDMLPRLRLRSGEKIVELDPELIIFTWAIAGLKIGVGKYTIPANLPAGSYDAHGLFVNNSESKPYWSKIQVK
ncbi:hypothetical protein [Dyadobacter alkalitolerans]|uniref:hypothetical protein n=1 Tax=Dyadobacter alkalitolerans TaxID=492736 RepID=UPI00047D70B5|nr:hypothetical protein [Dyadobacter alkalitolerans]